MRDNYEIQGCTTAGSGEPDDSSDGEEKGAEELAAEMSQFESATEGDTTMGTIMEPPEGNERGEIEVRVENTLDEFTQPFEKPKPPMDEYAFYRLAEAYGTGLADTTDLGGAKVPCRYADGEWRIDVPEPDRTLLERASERVQESGKDGIARGVCLLVGSLLLAPLFPVWAIPAAAPIDREITAALTVFAALFWAWVLVSIFLF